MKIGYARISSKTQNVERQLKELEENGCEEIFVDIASGKNFDRPEYIKMKKLLRKGDELIIHDLSRFGRNKDEIIKEWKEIIDLNVDIVVLNMPVLNTAQFKEIEGVGKLISEIFLAVMSWNVEEERRRIREAQKEGIEIAKKKGKFKGRPLKYHEHAKKPSDLIIYNKIKDMLLKKESVMDISKTTGVSRATIYNIKNRIGLKENSK